MFVIYKKFQEKYGFTNKIPVIYINIRIVQIHLRTIFMRILAKKKRKKSSLNTCSFTITWKIETRN